MRPRRPRLAIGCALCVLLASRDVNAQPADERSPIQLGGSAGVLFFLPTIGARLSVPLRPPLALEGVAEYVPSTLDDDGAAWLIFQAQLRHRLNRGQTWRMHATYGAALFAKYTHWRESRQARPDGSVIVFPEYRRMHVAGPTCVHAGFGAERSLSERVLMRWDVQVLVPVGVKLIPAPRAVFGVAWQRGTR